MRQHLDRRSTTRSLRARRQSPHDEADAPRMAGDVDEPVVDARPVRWTARHERRCASALAARCAAAPVLTAVVMLERLALGIGATTAIFTVVGRP